MHYGSTEICQENLYTFLSVAEELQLKGFTGNEEQIEVPESKDKIKSEQGFPPTSLTQKAFIGQPV